jgi:hypothetical protein
VAQHPDAVYAAISRKEAAVGKACFAERFIEGREFTACMYGDKTEVRVLDPYEWVFEGFEEQHKAKIITYDAKWNEHSFGFDTIVARYDFPARSACCLSGWRRSPAMLGFVRLKRLRQGRLQVGCQRHAMGA